jgi:hypothetical protein
VSAIIVSSRARLRSEEIIRDSGVAGALGEFPMGRTPVDMGLRARAAAIIARVRPINRAGQLLGGIGAVLALLFDQREDLLFGLS